MPEKGILHTNFRIIPICADFPSIYGKISSYGWRRASKIGAHPCAKDDEDTPWYSFCKCSSRNFGRSTKSPPETPHFLCLWFHRNPSLSYRLPAIGYRIFLYHLKFGHWNLIRNSKFEIRNSAFSIEKASRAFLHGSESRSRTYPSRL